MTRSAPDHGDKRSPDERTLQPEGRKRSRHPGSHALSPVNPDIADANAEKASAGAHPGYADLPPPSTLTLSSPPQAGVSKGEAQTVASWFETRRKGGAPHHEE
ncbi:hypothetical protein BRADO3749 [Bradyrhizobium sp. ORS 278]|nr:hypothetical protein BRADO3749 [Bradyrhizobium sp. ORS 278]